MHIPVRRLYPCKRSELYTICYLGWNACQANIAVFAVFASYFTPAFVAAKIAAVTAAQNLPDEQTQSSATDALRISLTQQGDIARLKFQSLKAYIRRNFPKSQWKTLFISAGGTYYTQVGNENWDSTEQMFTYMIAFITTNSVALLAGGNMPATFLADITALHATFHTDHLNYIQTYTATMTLTDDKTTAENEIFTDLMDMFRIAKLLGFSKTLMKSFTFQYILNAISGAGLTSVKGTVTSQATGLPIYNAKVTITDLGITVFTQSDGTYTFPSFNAGPHKIEVTVLSTSLPQYLPQSQDINLTAGSVTTIDFQMLQ